MIPRPVLGPGVETLKRLAGLVPANAGMGCLSFSGVDGVLLYGRITSMTHADTIATTDTMDTTQVTKSKRKLATFRDVPIGDRDEVRAIKNKVFDHTKPRGSVALTLSDLRKRDDWNDARIEKYLGAPDFTTENSYRKNQLINWYLVSRIAKAESYKTFQKEVAATREVTRKHKASAQKAVATKRAKTERVFAERVAKVRLHKGVCGLDEDALFAKAVDHYNDIQEERSWFYDDLDWTPADVGTASEEFLHRIAVNYLRHAGTNYDNELEKYFSMVGGREMVARMRAYVYVLIAQEYPLLQPECSRQMAERGLDEAAAWDLLHNRV